MSDQSEDPKVPASRSERLPSININLKGNSGGGIRDVMIILIVAGFVLIPIIFVVMGAQKFKDFIGDFPPCILNCGSTTINTSTVIIKLDEQRWVEGTRSVDSFTVESEQSILEIFGANLLPEKSLIYQAHVEITAGVDFDLVDMDEAVEVDGGTVTITLPKAQLRDCILDETQSEFIDKDWCEILGVGTGCADLENRVRSEALLHATNADHSEVLDEAFTQVGEFLRDLLGSIDGVDRVVVRQSDESVPLVSGVGTCQSYYTGG